MINKTDLLIGYYEDTLSEKEKIILRKKINSSETFRDEFYETCNLLRSQNLNQWDELTDEETNHLYEKVMLKNKKQSFFSKLFQFIMLLFASISEWFNTLIFKLTNRQYAYAEIKLGKSNQNKPRTRKSTTSYEDSILILHKFNSYMSKLSFEINPASKTFSVYVYMYKDKKVAKNIRIKLSQDKDQPVSRLITDESEYFDDLSFGTYAMEVVYKNESQGSFSFVVDENGPPKKLQ